MSSKGAVICCRGSARWAGVIAALCVSSLAQQKASISPFHDAEELLAQHRLAEARTDALEQLKTHPSVDGYNLLGIIDSSQQNYSEAVDAFQHALRMKPGSAKTLNNLGNAYAAQRQFDLAERQFRAALRSEPANLDANYNLGVLLMMNGSAAESIPYLLHVHTPQAQLNLIRAYLQTHRTADALRAADDLANRNKSDVKVQFSLGLLLASERQYKAAQRVLDQAAALQPDSLEVLYNLAQVLLRTGENAKAELILNRAIRIQPENADALYLLAQSYAGQSRPLDALDALVRAHKVAPDNVDVISLTAQITMSQNYFEDAIPLLESGLKIAPKRPDLLAALGQSYFMAGKTEKAIEEFNMLLDVEKSARSYAFLGLSYRNLGRFDEAKKYFDRGIALDPHSATCLFNLGFIAERQGDAAGAQRYFEETLRYNPKYSDALLELANIHSAAKRLPQAEELLRRYVKVAPDPANGYYKLAMVERGLHENEAANRDLNVFKTLSKNAQAGPYPFEHLFDYLNSRSELGAGARTQLDITELQAEIQRHPNQPQNLYMLVEAYLKSGRLEEARKTVGELDNLSSNDFRTLNGTGVLLSRYRLYDDAIAHFQSALQANPNSDEVKFNLANAYFEERKYAQAMETAQQVSEAGKKDDAYLTLMGDIYAHLGDNANAAAIFNDAISRNPDNDQNYLSLALVNLRSNDAAAAQKVLAKGQTRIPHSGKISWGLGLVAAMAGNADEAASRFEHAIELLPEWAGAYSTLGVLYFQIGEIDKAKEVLNRFKESSVGPSLDISRIEQVLDRATAPGEATTHSLAAEKRQQLLQFALSLSDQTL
ncbi:tetratricopeptide repeat protein [Occallatibacter savannae]|uniref:tetratricopeptide repeat protein n=1 Tax=Occallatibacter savannae TaxID=1002691 RepID=UPI000D6930DB|nr:tetratricopeptide repeat protein [Occallatibacter savannae]